MAMDFPASPAVGQVYAPAGGPTYIWNGTAWMAGQVAGFSTALRQNKIVNGAIQVSQETAFNTNVTTGSHVVDQWQAAFSGPTGGTHVNFAANDSATTGHNGQIAISCASTAYASVAAGNYALLVQLLEGLPIADLGWGSAQAIPAVLSLEVFTNLVGTFAVAVRNAANDRSIVFPLAITAATTWTKFSFAIPAITTGTWPKTNANGANIALAGMAGSTFHTTPGAWATGNYFGVAGMANILSATSQQLFFRKIGLYADPYNTGIAPPFELPDYATELVRCQRYWQKANGLILGTGAYVGGVVHQQSSPLPVAMRATPTAGSSSVVYSNANSLTLTPMAISLNATTIRTSVNSVAAGNMYVTYDQTLTARM